MSPAALFFFLFIVAGEFVTVLIMIELFRLFLTSLQLLRAFLATALPRVGASRDAVAGGLGAGTLGLFLRELRVNKVV